MRGAARSPGVPLTSGASMAAPWECPVLLLAEAVIDRERRACDPSSALYLATPATIQPHLQAIVGHVFGRNVHDPLSRGVDGEAKCALAVLRKKDKHIINWMRAQHGGA